MTAAEVPSSKTAKKSPLIVEISQPDPLFDARISSPVSPELNPIFSSPGSVDAESAELISIVSNFAPVVVESTECIETVSGPSCVYAESAESIQTVSSSGRVDAEFQKESTTSCTVSDLLSSIVLYPSKKNCTSKKKINRKQLQVSYHLRSGEIYLTQIKKCKRGKEKYLSLIHISEPTRPY